jgi:hypothetical protein
METSHQIDVISLDDAHRRAFEDVIGAQLRRNQRLVISVAEIDVAPTAGQAGQTIRDWTGVYEGLSDADVEAIDLAVNARADLTRHLP